MIDKESLHKEIDLIQNIISRMAANSFLIRGWYITVLSAIIVVTRNNFIEHFAVSYWVIIVVPILFWFLDSYYLGQESLYRKLYSWVIKERLQGNQNFLYDLNAKKRFGGQFKPILKAFFSPTLLAFYALPIIIMIILLCNAK
ncbi:MAG: hypothetical protein V4722_06850 [Bacteroidota bacterium]